MFKADTIREMTERKQRFFIYDRKEMGVLMLLGVMVALFSFTLGVHLGKRITPSGPVLAENDAAPADTVADKLPNRQELAEQGKGIAQAVDETLDKSLHEEVTKSGIKLDTHIPVELPEEAKAPDAGKTSEAPKGQDKKPAETEQQVSAPSEKALSLSFPRPGGTFTLQIGSYPNMDEARDQVDSLKALGMKPFLRTAEVKGKGKWFRVYLGGYESKDQAEKAGERFQSRHVIDAYIVAKMPE